MKRIITALILTLSFVFTVWVTETNTTAHAQSTIDYTIQKGFVSSGLTMTYSRFQYAGVDYHRYDYPTFYEDMNLDPVINWPTVGTDITLKTKQNYFDTEFIHIIPYFATGESGFQPPPYPITWTMPNAAQVTFFVHPDYHQQLAPGYNIFELTLHDYEATSDDIQALLYAEYLRGKREGAEAERDYFEQYYRELYEYSKEDLESNSYTDGYQDGKADWYQQGKDDGYQDGLIAQDSQISALAAIVPAVVGTLWGVAYDFLSISVLGVNLWEILLLLSGVSLILLIIRLVK